jgi:hypothetical protein
MTDAGPLVQAVYGRQIEEKKEERGEAQILRLYLCRLDIHPWF